MVLHHRRLSLLLGTLLGGCSGASEVCEATADFTLPETLQRGGSVQIEGSDIAECAVHLWDFGDGTQSEETSPSHTYDEAGHFQVVHRQTLPDGASSSASRLITVHEARSGPTSQSSTLLSDGEDFIAVVPELGVVRTGPSGLQIWTGCEQPRTAAWAGSQLAVACEGDDAVVLLEELSEVERVDLGAGTRPYGVAYDGTAWHASLTGTGELASYDGGLSRQAAIEDPRAVAVGPEGRVFVSRLRSPDGVGRIAELGGAELTLAFADVVDSDNTNRGVPNLLGHLVVSPDGGTLYVPGQISNTARGLVRDGRPMTHDTSLRAMLRGVDLDSGEEITPLDRQFDNLGRAGAAALSPLGDWLWVVFPDAETVFRIDAYSGRPAGSIHSVGRGLSGIVVGEETVAVHAWLDRQVRLYDATSFELLEVYPTVQSEPLPADVLRGKQIFHDSLDRRITADGYISCAACHPDGDQDGLVWDFTDRGEGLRNTSSLLGRAGTAMGRLHWSGNFDEIQDFEHDMRGPFAGQGFLSAADWTLTDDTLGEPKAGRSEDLDALAAYAASLDQTPRSPHPADAAGQALFTDLGCADCHPAPLYTDSTLSGPRHDIGSLTGDSGQRLGGTLDGLDTPTLLGVESTGPWLHDGSALTLEEAIEAHSIGLSRSPSPSEIASVAAFVRSL